MDHDALVKLGLGTVWPWWGTSAKLGFLEMVLLTSEHLQATACALHFSALSGFSLSERSPWHK